MRNGQNNKRMRGRNRRGHNPLTRVYESNGPDVKIRGTAHHIAEKYLQLARDAQSSGDPVTAEGYLQHAEHYFRLIMAAQAQMAQQNPHHQQQPYQRPDMDNRDEFDEEGEDIGTGEQPNVPGFPGAQQMQRPQQQPYQQNQPQPNIQGSQPRREADESGDAGLPAFITGSGAPQPQMNGADHEQGERSERGDRNDRFGRRRRRFRPRGSQDFEQGAQGENAPSAAPQSGGELAPKAGE